MGRNQAAAVLVDRMFQFRCDLVQTVGDDPTFLQRQMQGLVGLVGKELIVPDLLPERRAPDQIGMEQQALRGGRLHSRGVVQTDDLAGSERYDRALLIVVPAASVGQFAAYFLFEEPRRRTRCSSCRESVARVCSDRRFRSAGAGSRCRTACCTGRSCSPE